MASQYRRSESSSTHNAMKMKPSIIGEPANRAPLRQRQMNGENDNYNGSTKSASQFPVKHQKSSRSSKPREPAPPVEIEELRRKPNGEGHTVHRYIRGKMLGKGGFAKVYLCTSLDTNRTYAVKIVPKANLVKTRARQKLQAEIKIHRSLKHKHVCEYKHFFEDKTNCYILLELCQNQSMNELIKRRKRLTEPEVKYYLSQLLNSVQYMHKLNVIHRDLKLGNLFLDKHLRVKVGDFGLATKLTESGEKRKTICGTPNYIAPEVIEGDKEKRGHSFEVDVWSMGVICFTLLVGKPPYESKDVKSTYQRILRNEYSFPSHIPLSQHVRDLIASMLQTRPDKRPSLETIVSHPFFTHDPTKIPRSLPACCTHVAPDWQEDAEGYLIPVLAESDDQNQRSTKATSRRKEVKSDRDHDQAPNREDRHNVGKENDGLSRNPSSQFEIYSDNQPRRQSSARSERRGAPLSTNVHNSEVGEGRDTRQRDIEFTSQKRDDNADKITEQFAACNLQDNPTAEDVALELKPNDRAGSDADAKALETMYTRLRELSNRVDVAGGSTNFRPASPIQAPGAEKWVTRYVDYTSKYGLGFLFSDGSAGVYFNDSTKAVLVPKGESFIYVERKKSLEVDGERTEQVPEVHSLSKFPDSLQKKVTLLKHFRNYLIEQHKRDESTDEGLIDSLFNGTEEASRATVFLKKWVRTKHAILFRLSNHTVQVIFYDHTEILLTSEARIVTYVNKKRERETYHLDDIMMATEHSDIKKRLKYAEGILQQLVSIPKK